MFTLRVRDGMQQNLIAFIMFTLRVRDGMQQNLIAFIMSHCSVNSVKGSYWQQSAAKSHLFLMRIEAIWAVMITWSAKFKSDSHVSFAEEARRQCNIKSIKDGGQKLLFRTDVDKMFKMFLKEVSYANQGCIYLIKNTVKTNIVK